LRGRKTRIIPPAKNITSFCKQKRNPSYRQTEKIDRANHPWEQRTNLAAEAARETPIFPAEERRISHQIISFREEGGTIYEGGKEKRKRVGEHSLLRGKAQRISKINSFPEGFLCKGGGPRGNKGKRLHRRKKGQGDRGKPVKSHVKKKNPFR